MELRSGKRVASREDAVGGVPSKRHRTAPEGVGAVPFDGDKDRYLATFSERYLFSNDDIHRGFNKRVDREWRSLVRSIIEKYEEDEDESDRPQTDGVLLRGSVFKRTGIVMQRDFDIYIVLRSPDSLHPLVSAESPQRGQFSLGEGFDSSAVLRNLHVAAMGLSKAYRVCCCAPALTVSKTIRVNKRETVVSFDILPAVPYRGAHLVPMDDDSAHWCVTHTLEEKKHVERMVKEIGRLQVLHPLRLLRLFKLMRNWALPSCAFDHTLMRLFDHGRISKGNTITDVLSVVLSDLIEGLQAGGKISHYYHGEDLLEGASDGARSSLLRDAVTVLGLLTTLPWNDENNLFDLTQEYITLVPLLGDA